MASLEAGRHSSYVVSIPLSEYQSLVETARRYAGLRNALRAGGTDDETIDVLISAGLPSNLSEETCATTETTTETVGSAPAATSQPTHQNLDPFPPRVATADEEEEEHEAPDGLIKEATGNKKQPKRSIALSGLAADTTLPQIAEVVRGGTILDMFLRPGTKSAQVSFVDPAAAEAFLAHAQKRVIHIGGNKITVAWAGKQTVFRDYQIRRITTYGATRNVVVRNAPPGMTEASIRGDLEHIHRLEVVEVKFDKDHIFISLNNVLLAITARQCMYSRERYQRMKLEFYLDECAGPLLPVPVPTVAGMQPLPKPVAVKPAQIPVRNRFELLDDDAEDE